MNLLKYNHDRICRVCLSESGEMNSIFGTSANISNVLMSLAAVEINENDGLPNQICTTCVYEANNACFFKQKCEQSDKLLRNSIENNFCDVKVELNNLFNPSCDTNVTDFFKSENKILENTANNFDDVFNSKDSSSLLLEEPIKTDPDGGELEEKRNKKRGRPKKDIQPVVATEDRKIKLQCNECDENFDKKIDLKRHIAVDHINMDGEKKFECIECNKMYPTDALLNVHMKTHNGKVYNCDNCPKKFSRLDTLVEHKKRHSNERTHLCTKCGKGFYNQMYLDRHMLTHNKDHLEKPVHQCTICGKQMAHSNHLMVHMRAHKDRTGPLINDNENKKWILCSVCGRSCSSRSNLAVHMRRHTGKMTNFCSVCGKGYPRTTDLTIHMRQHTGEKPFVCQICDRRFARSDKLAIHMRTHTGEKPYVCSVCGRAFAQSNDLASHKRRNACTAQQANQESANNVYINVTADATQQQENLAINQVYAITSNIKNEEQIVSAEVNRSTVPIQLSNNRTAEISSIPINHRFYSLTTYPTTTFLPNFTTSSFR